MLYIILMWIISPLPLAIALIVLSAKYNAIKKERDELRQQLGGEVVQPTVEPVIQKEVSPPVPLASAPVKIREKTGNEKKQAVNATLIIGVLLVVAAGLIFATTTWRIIPAILKVLLICSIAGLFFLASYLAEKKFKLKMTAIAFYHLGCIFVPVSILSIGYFRLFGSWFSIGGGGTYWLQFFMAVTFGGLAYLGYRHYKQTSFYYCSWAASACAVWLLSQGVSNDWQVSFLWVSLYGTGIATWAILVKNKTWLIVLHPLFAAMCTLQALYIYCPNLHWFFVSGSVCMLIWFWLYYFSGRVLPRSFDTDCSRWIFPGLVLLIVITQQDELGIGTSLLLLLGVCLSVGFLFTQYQDIGKKTGIAWTLPILGALVFYLTLGFWDQYSSMTFAYQYFILYTVLILGMALAKWGLRGRYHCDLLKHPAMSLAVFLALIEIVWVRDDNVGICILWELVPLCIYLRKNQIYAVGATILGLFMPSITAKLLGVDIWDGVYWLLIAATGACYYKCSHFLKNKGYYKTVLHHCGLTGLYLGAVGTGLIFAVNGLLLPELICFLMLIATVDVACYKKHGNLAYAGINLFIIPLVYGGLLVHTDLKMDLIRTIMALLGIVMMGVGRLLFPTILKANHTREEAGGYGDDRIDYLGVIAVIPVCYLWSGASHWWQVISLLFLALWFANGLGRQNESVDAVFTGGLVFTLYGVVLRLINYEISREFGYLLIALQGLVYCLIAYIKRQYYCGKVLKWSGLLGYYVGGSFAIYIFFATMNISPWLVLGLLALIAAGDVLGAKTRQPWGYAMMNLAIIPIVSRLVSHMQPSNESYIIAGLVTGVLMMLGGRILCPRIYERGEDGRIIKLDYLGISAIMGLFIILTRIGEKIWLFTLCIYGGIWWLNWCKRQRSRVNTLAIINAFIMLFSAVYTQPFVEIPDLFLLEYLFADFVLFGILSTLVWKNKKRWMGIYWFILTVLFAVCQGVACIVMEEGVDVLILGIAMLVALSVAYKKKNLSWLSTSLGTLAVLVLYITKSFWLNIAWWVYLLLAGLFLIGMAAYHEYKKRENKSDDPKWKNMIDEWTWKV